ncbi:MAG TPA: pitrilysin family protein [Chryseolinea sp.]
MLDRTIAPPFNRTTSFDLIQPQKKILKGGAECYFVLGGTQEVSKIEIVFPAGRWVEKVWGASYFTSNLLSKGTSNKTSFEIAHLLDLYGAHLEINSGLDNVSISLYILNKNFEQSVKLFFELLTQSVLPQDELDLLKSIYLQNLRVNYEKTSFHASRLIRKNLFKETHPYGKELDDSDIGQLHRNSLQQHYTTFFKNGTILVSGKVSERNQDIIADVFSSLGNNIITAKTFSNESRESYREVMTKEGSVQASVRLAKRSISKTHPDYVDALFLNHILGGYFGSRLMKNIREDKGLSYGISSSLHTLKNDSYLVIGADVNRENLDLTFNEIAKEIKRLRTEKIDDEELDVARNHFIGGLQLEITTSFAHADKVKSIVLYNLPENHYQKMIARIDRITSDDLIKIADQYFAEDSFIQVAVG